MPERKQAPEEEEFNLVDPPELLHDKFIELSLPNLQHMFPYIRDIDLVVDIIDSLAVKIDTTLLNNPFGLAARREDLQLHHDIKKGALIAEITGRTYYR